MGIRNRRIPYCGYKLQMGNEIIETIKNYIDDITFQGLKPTRIIMCRDCLEEVLQDYMKDILFHMAGFYKTPIKMFGIPLAVDEEADFYWKVEVEE